MPNRLTEQRRLSVYSWNRGPRRGKEEAIERRLAGKWHIITLQEAIEYLEHGFLTNRFHLTHYGGCAILFNQFSLFSDIKVSSIYLHDTGACHQDKTKEGESGWVLQGVISRASFRRQPRSGQKSFTVMSLHINNNYAKKRGIGKKFLLTMRAVFAGRARGPGRPQPTNILEEAFAGTDFPMPRGPTPLWGPGAVPGEWTDVRGFVKPPDSCDKWKVRLHGAFTVPRETLGIGPKDQSCHHEVRLHLDLPIPA